MGACCSDDATYNARAQKRLNMSAKRRLDEEEEEKEGKEEELEFEVTLDPHTAAVTPLLILGFNKYDLKAGQPLHEIVPVPTQQPRVLHTVPMLDNALQVVKDDEDSNLTGVQQGIKDMLFAFTSNRDRYPLIDNDQDEFPSAEAAMAWRRRHYGKVLARTKPNVIWAELDSDEAMSRLAFASRASVYTHVYKAGATVFAEDTGIQIADEYAARIVYYNDITVMQKYPTRELFFNLGACLLFDAQFKLIAMYASEFKRTMYADRDGESDDWRNAKTIWKTSTDAFCGFGEHLATIHIMEAAGLATSVRENLGPDHPMRRLLRIFTFGTAWINYNALSQTLMEGDFTHRGFSLEYDSHKQLALDFVASYQFVPFVQRYDHEVAERIHDDRIFPIATDIPAIHAVMHEFVQSYVRVFYADTNAIHNDAQLLAFWRQLLRTLRLLPAPASSSSTTTTEQKEDWNENANASSAVVNSNSSNSNASAAELGLRLGSIDDFIAFVTNLICVVTVYHEMMGTVNEFYTRPDMALHLKPFRNGSKNNVSTVANAALISIVTSIRMPELVNDWTYLLLDTGDAVKNNAQREIFDKWQTDLKSLSQAIDVRNESRRQPINFANPRVLECSVNV